MVSSQHHGNRITSDQTLHRNASRQANACTRMYHRNIFSGAHSDRPSPTPCTNAHTHTCEGQTVHLFKNIVHIPCHTFVRVAIATNGLFTVTLHTMSCDSMQCVPCHVIQIAIIANIAIIAIIGPSVMQADTEGHSEWLQLVGRALTNMESLNSIV